MSPFRAVGSKLQEALLSKPVEIESWFRREWCRAEPPFYGSVDLRNAIYKLAPVDVNLFPAGFNNLNPNFMSLTVQALQATLNEIDPKITKCLIIPETHTRNIYYLENLSVLKEIFQCAGFDIRFGWMDPQVQQPQELKTHSGKKIKIEPLIRVNNKVGVQNFFPDVIILNNDLSSGIPEILQNCEQKIIPPLQSGWSSRLKSEYFRFYEEVVNEFSNYLNFDPWWILPYFDHCPEVNFMKKEGEACLVERAKNLLEKIRKKYQEYNIPQTPFLVIKADRGTYGMAVMMIRDAEELTQLNRKQRTHMSVIKGNVPVTKAILQEGVYTFDTVGEEKVVAEPVIYLMGRHVIGGFYRLHKQRGPDENLNSPGMDFVPMAFDKPCHMLPTENKVNDFYLYGIIARLATVAAARELQSFEKGK